MRAALWGAAMSERGVWCTEFIYCENCCKGFQCFLDDTAAFALTEAGPHKYWSGGQITPGVFAGRISGLHSGEEFEYWECDLLEKLSAHLCHPVRVAVISDTAGERVYTAHAPRP